MIGKKPVLFSCILLSGVLLSLAACKPGESPTEPQPIAPKEAAVVWDKTIGGDGQDELQTVIATSDGGYLLVGTSASTASGDKSEGRINRTYVADYWVVKINRDGTKQWDKTFAGADQNNLHSAAQTADGGYLLAGLTNSRPIGIDNKGLRDYWVIKLQADGTKEWDKFYGGSGWEDGKVCLAATPDGGFLLGGSSYSDASGDKSQPNKGLWSSSDYWVIKVDRAGSKQWDNAFGGSGSETLSAIIPSDDGGFLLGGTSVSSATGDKTQDSRGSTDYWVVKISPDGTKQWDKTLGGSGMENLYGMARSADGGYLLAGYSESAASGDKSQSPFTYYDFWVVKLDRNGAKQWDRGYEERPGHGVGYTVSIAATEDGGFLLGSTTYQQGQFGRSYTDYWVSKSGLDGNQQWVKTLGGDQADDLTAIVARPDGRFLVGGTSGSPLSRDKTQPTKGIGDYWIIELN